MNTKSPVPYIIAGAAGALVASILPLLINTTHADTKLLPFQGRLTDAAGAAIGDGAKIVEFKLYDAPTGGTAKWAGEVHKLSVNGGLVNTMLGSNAPLGGVDFATPTYLQITVDANADGQITAADPPLLPRQSVVGAVFASEALNARDSVKLAGADWSSIMVDGAGAPSNSPGTGFVKGAKIQAGSISNTQILAGTITADRLVGNTLTAAQIGSDAVNTDEIKDGAVTNPKILAGAVDLGKLAPNSVDGTKLINGSIATEDVADAAITSAKLSQDYAYAFEEAASGSNPSSTTGWQVRKLTDATTIAGSSISINTGTNTISLVPGTYYIQADAPCYQAGAHQLVLRDVTTSSAGPPTNTTAVLKGVSCYNPASTTAAGVAPLKGILVVSTATKNYQLWHYIDVNGSPTNTLGINTQNDSGVSNHWAQILIVRMR